MQRPWRGRKVQAQRAQVEKLALPKKEVISHSEMGTKEKEILASTVLRNTNYGSPWDIGGKSTGVQLGAWEKYKRT